MGHPILSTARVAAETRLQDLSSLDERVLRLVEDAFITAINEALGQLDDRLDDVEAVQRGELREVDLELWRGMQSGRVVYEPDHGFAQDAIDRPVLTQAHITEGDAVWFHARVLDARSMLVQWVSFGPAPATVKFAYLIG